MEMELKRSDVLKVLCYKIVKLTLKLLSFDFNSSILYITLSSPFINYKGSCPLSFLHYTSSSSTI